jgi:hypothetical protein
MVMPTPSFPELRKHFTPDTNYRIDRCEIVISLAEDHRRAKYSFRYLITVTGDKPETDWEIVIPSLPPNVLFDGAADAEGGLQHTFIPQGNATRIPIRYRRELARGSAPYQFSYSYETSVKSVVAPTMRGRFISYTDWLMPDVACGLMKVSIHLPRRCRAIQSFPAANLDSKVISIQYENMRPLEVFPFTLAYQHLKLGTEVWLWIASVVASTMLGWVLGQALG